MARLSGSPASTDDSAITPEFLATYAMSRVEGRRDWPGCVGTTDRFFQEWHGKSGRVRVKVGCLEFHAAPRVFPGSGLLELAVVPRNPSRELASRLHPGVLWTGKPTDRPIRSGGAIQFGSTAELAGPSGDANGAASAMREILDEPAPLT
jgi:hypothetical protein